MHELSLRIGGDGETTIIYHPNDPAAGDLAAVLGIVTSDQRGGHVLPLNPLKRWAFTTIRQIWGGRDKLAEWTRTWRGPWMVKIVDGPQLGPFGSHAAGCQAEVAYLLENL